MIKKVILAVCISIFLLSSMGCSEEGPAEKLGKKIDNAVTTTKKESQSALDKFNEDAENAFKDVKKKVNDTASDIGDGIKEAADTVASKVEDITK